MLRQLRNAHANDSKYARNLAIALNNLSFVLRKSDDAAAERGAREAIEILNGLADAQPDRVQYQDDLALCYNNLAAMEAHRGQLASAIDWHEKAIALQERLVRKSPAIVRHRGDLATSLNNLGVAHCRAGNADQADAAFGRARELLATLADDYPNEWAYRSSLAALLNNQALALAGAGRHEDALRIYPTAIEAQRVCWQRLPGSSTMREILSKMYYNYGQSLRTMGRQDEAAKAALARREVWQMSGERLVGVAAELAELGRAPVSSADAPLPEKARRQLDDEVVATLWLARESGWPSEIDLATDERFAYLSRHDRFAALVAELQSKPKERSSKNSTGLGKSHSNVQ